MTSAQLLRHDRPHLGRNGPPTRSHRGWCLPRLVEPEELTLFSDRIDHAREYESTVRDFIRLHDLALSTDGYDS